MKLVEAQILDELKNLLCEDVRELVPVAVLEAWPAGYIPSGTKRFAPLGPEEKKQADLVTDDAILQIHTSQFGAGHEFDDPKIGEPLYRDCPACEGTGFDCDECGGKGYLGGLTRTQLKELFVFQSSFRPPPKIRKLVQKWQNLDPEYIKLKDQAAAARDELNSLYRRMTKSNRDKRTDLIDPDKVSQAEAKVDKAYAKVEAYINKHMLYMTRFEMDEIKDGYWLGIRRLAKIKANRNLKHKGVSFKEVDPKSYIKQAVEQTLGEYAKSHINITVLDQLSGVDFAFNNQGQPIVQSAYSYVKNLFNNTPALITSYMDFSNQIESKVESGERSGNLSPEEILHFAKLGAFRPSILEKLTSLQISLKGDEVANLERIIREVAENLEEAGDFATSSAEPKLKKDAGKLSKKDLSRIADIYDIDDPDLALQQKQYEDEKIKEYYRQYYDDNQDQDLQEATVTPGAIEWDQIPAYAPMDEAPNEEFDVSELPRYSWDKRRRPSEYGVTEDVTWVQLAGFDYSGYDKKRSRWEHSFGDTNSGLSGKTEPYHAILEWLWETFLKIKLDPEPYDGFARMPSQSWSVDGEPGSPSELIFYDSSKPYKYDVVKTKTGTKFRKPRNLIYGMESREEDEEGTKFSHYAKTGPVPNQVPVPDRIYQTAISPESMNVEKYNVIFKLENPSLGKTPDKLKENIDKLINFSYNDLAKRGIIAKIFKNDELTSTKYELKVDPQGHRLLQVQNFKPFIKVMFYTYRITSDDSDELLDLTSSETFWKETEKIRERIRASKIFANTKNIEKLADIVDENPEVFRLNKQAWPANLIRFAIGSGSVEGLDSEGNVVRSSIGKFFTPNQLKSMSDRVVRDASRRKGIDPFDAAPKPTDWDFPVQILKSAIEDLQIIYTQTNGDPTKQEYVQHVIDGLNHAIDNAAASDEELKRRARGRAQEKEMDWWRKEGLAKDMMLKYRRRNEIRHNIVKSKIALSKLIPGVKISDSDLYSYKIFDLIKDMVKQYENLLNQNREKDEVPVRYWDDRYPYDSFLKVKKGFEHEIISELEENAAERAQQLGLSPDELSLPMIGDQELDPETYSLFTDIEDNPKSYNYGKSKFNLEHGIQPKISLNGEPIISYQRDQQLDSKEDALVLFYEKLKNIKDQIFSQDEDLMIADLERIIEGLDLQD